MRRDCLATGCVVTPHTPTRFLKSKLLNSFTNKPVRCTLLGVLVSELELNSFLGDSRSRKAFCNGGKENHVYGLALIRPVCILNLRGATKQITLGIGSSRRSEEGRCAGRDRAPLSEFVIHTSHCLSLHRGLLKVLVKWAALSTLPLLTEHSREPLDKNANTLRIYQTFQDLIR